MKSTQTQKRHLEVRLAQNQLEIEQTLSLRYNIFNLELEQGLPASHATRKDRDEYDLYCDHLIVVDKARDNMIVGTYRMLRGAVARKHKGFYSESEFILEGVYDLEDEVCEIGRSCVHPEYRDGSVITYLWIGLGMYMNEFNVRYLMGCGSVHTGNAEEASKIYAYLKSKNAIADLAIKATPRPDHVMPGFRTDYVIDDEKAVSRSIPPLIKGYIRAGSKIIGTPAYDAVFGTTDYFITFNLSEVEKRYGRHYFRDDRSLMQGFSG
ncbi:MAG: GNAT family N-acetyltransferase [Leptospiraceae bacterium]|nr:GNAT family N-acetyltransferase [Leptospiraceae bacterium]MCB1314659.1 GNAT family N-acetyltransferase [Leptospiraceae bacterium]MCB1320442.1 GNAT family N-acetyltransferase [Leptospiraceae bacterium]